MLSRALRLTVFALLLAAAPASATIVPSKGMAGVTLGQCQERVIEILGFPDRTFGSHDFAGHQVELLLQRERAQARVPARPGRSAWS